MAAVVLAAVAGVVVAGKRMDTPSAGTARALDLMFLIPLCTAGQLQPLPPGVPPAAVSLITRFLRLQQ